VTDPTKILVVDDEVEIRKLLNVFLSVEDFEVGEAENGKSVATVLHKPRPVVSDLRPVPRLGQSPPGAPLLCYGRRDYLQQPIDADRLYEVVVKSDLCRFSPAVAVSPASLGNDDCFLMRWIGAQAFTGLEPIHNRHA